MDDPIAEAAARYARAEAAWVPVAYTTHFLKPALWQQFQDAQATLAMLIKPGGTVAVGNRTYRERDGRIETVIGPGAGT